MRTALQAVLLSTIFIFCTALTLGLTWVPCYAALCSEEFFTADTRYHIATYYALLAVTAVALLLRAYVPACYRFSSTNLTKHKVPVFNKHFTVGGLTLAIWLILVVLITTVFWVSPLITFWSARTKPYAWAAAQVPLVVTGIIGHHADLLLGLLLIPVGRNSLLIRVFRLPYGVLLYAHKLLAYLMVLGVFAHGFAYTVFWVRYEKKPFDDPARAEFDVNNPTLTVAEAQERGAWSRTVLGTGLASFVFMIVIIITALPALRRKAYNLFYYTHIVMSILIFVGTCFHASTNFYFLLPGLLLWLYDWLWRIFCGDTGLGKQVTITLASAGGEWYRMALPLSAVTPSNKIIDQDSESQMDKISTSHPLQTYYINIPSISRIQNHAFTAAKVATSYGGPVLLFQKVQSSATRRSPKAQDHEWTWKLSRFIDEHKGEKVLKASARVEGPYEPPYNGHETADYVICIVGGTGLTGAYSLAQWWLNNRRTEPNSRFVLIWTVRYEESLELEEWRDLVGLCSAVPNMSLSTHCSSQQGRLDIAATIQDLVIVKQASNPGTGRSAWVYASGPNSLLDVTADACIDIERQIRKGGKSSTSAAFAITSMSHSIAEWEV